MKSKRMQVAALAALILVAGSGTALAQAPGSSRSAAEQWSDEGLTSVEIKGVDTAYVRPDASLKGYGKVMLAPMDVAFRRDWGRSSGLSRTARVDPRDAQRIREDLAALVREEVVRELEAGGYVVVDKPGEDVLEVRAQIVNLYVQAPDLRTATGTTRVYAVSAGEMSLVAELRDSLTGDVAMRVYDRAKARETAHLHWVSRTENRAEARRAAAGWASVLRQLLDQARQFEPK